MARFGHYNHGETPETREERVWDFLSTTMSFWADSETHPHLVQSEDVCLGQLDRKGLPLHVKSISLRMIPDLKSVMRQ